MFSGFTTEIFVMILVCTKCPSGWQRAPRSNMQIGHLKYICNVLNNFLFVDFVELGGIFGVSMFPAITKMYAIDKTEIKACDA